MNPSDRGPTASRFLGPGALRRRGRSLALDAFTADVGQPWTLDLDWPEGPGLRLVRR